MVARTFPLRSCFVAVPLEHEAKRRFHALQQTLGEFSDCLRLQSPETPHITLQYWKEVMEIEYRQVQTQAAVVAKKSAPFLLHCEGVSTFGTRGRDSVLFMDVPFSEELAKLKKRCPWQSDRPFTPHLTLARITHPERFATVKKRILKALDASRLEVSADRLRLYAEIDGRKQTPLEDFPFVYDSSGVSS